MSAGGNLIFFGSVILIVGLLIFSGLFPSKSLNDPTLHEPWILLPLVGVLSFIELLTLCFTAFGSSILLIGVITIKKNK